MIMTSDSLYTRSLAAARRDHTTDNPLREFFVYIPRSGTVRSSADIRFSIGLVIATIWSYEILKSGNLLSPFLWLAILREGSFQGGWDLTGGNECQNLGRFIFHSCLFSSQP